MSRMYCSRLALRVHWNKVTQEPYSGCSWLIPEIGAHWCEGWETTVFAEAGQGVSVKVGVGKLGLSVCWGLAETEKRWGRGTAVGGRSEFRLSNYICSLSNGRLACVQCKVHAHLHTTHNSMCISHLHKFSPWRRSSGTSSPLKGSRVSHEAVESPP